MEGQAAYHTPVLLHDCIEGLDIQPGGVYVDVTFGGGGHSQAILEKLGDAGRLYAFDQDEDALANVPSDQRFSLIRQNFRYLKNNLRLAGVRQIDGLLADLGVSSHQFDEAGRGFSTRFDAELDMRMDADASLTARKILDTYSETELIRVLRAGSDLERIPSIARRLVTRQGEVETTEDLKKALAGVAPQRKQAQFYAQVFQALRIEVNEELGALEELLTQAIGLLKPGARLVVISYHSIEDRMVKHFVRAGNKEGEPERDEVFGSFQVPLKAINRKVIVPGEQEVERNPRARSAKLRIAEKQ